MNIEFIHEVMLSDDVDTFKKILVSHQYDINKVFVETEYQKEDFFTMAAIENAHNIIKMLVDVGFDFNKSFSTQGNTAVQHMLSHSYVESLREYHRTSNVDIIEFYKGYNVKYFNPLDEGRLVSGNVFDSLLDGNHVDLIEELLSVQGMGELCLGEDSAYDYFKKLIKLKNNAVFKFVFNHIASKLTIPRNRMTKLIGFADRGGTDIIKSLLESYVIGSDFDVSNELPNKPTLKM